MLAFFFKGTFKYPLKKIQICHLKNVKKYFVYDILYVISFLIIYFKYILLENDSIRNNKKLS